MGAPSTPPREANMLTNSYPFLVVAYVASTLSCNSQTTQLGQQTVLYTMIAGGGLPCARASFQTKCPWCPAQLHPQEKANCSCQTPTQGGHEKAHSTPYTGTVDKPSPSRGTYRHTNEKRNLLVLLRRLLGISGMNGWVAPRYRWEICHMGITRLQSLQFNEVKHFGLQGSWNPKQLRLGKSPDWIPAITVPYPRS
jgi:hypothetical protein